jgi:hypothetical protein
MEEAGMTMDKLLEWVRTAKEGQRNNVLYQCSCRAAENGQELAVVEDLFVAAAVENGHVADGGEKAVRATIRSAFKRVARDTSDGRGTYLRTE